VSLDWDSLVAFALTLPGAELSSSYGKPAVKVNDRAFLMPSREADSFGVAIDLDTLEIWKEAEPDIFWQSPHYEGWPTVLVRYSAEPERALEAIRRGHEWTAARPKIGRASCRERVS
jgi:hypothetical protein